MSKDLQGYFKKGIKVHKILVTAFLCFWFSDLTNISRWSELWLLLLSVLLTEPKSI